MIVEIRKTSSGAEYWDNEKKQSYLVPAGQKTEFEVTKEYDSLLPSKEVPKPESDTYTVDLDSMKVPQLKKYAADNDIKIPSGVTKKDDILDVIRKAFDLDNGDNDDDEQ